MKPFCDALFPSQFAPMLQSVSQGNHELASSGNCIDSDVDKLKNHQLTSGEISPTGSPTETVAENNVMDRCMLLSDNELKKQPLEKTDNTSVDNCILNCEETFRATESLSNSVNAENNCLSPYTLSRNLPTDKLDIQLDYDLLHSTHDINQNEKVEVDYSDETIDKVGDEICKMENGRKRYICTNCNRIFNSCNALKYHNRTHLGFRPHKCDICNKSFFAISALKTHIRTHTGDKPFECMHCDRKFRQWGDLKYHIVSIHSNEKNHQCEFCGKAFSRKYSLVVHLRIHTSERNYKCEFCAKSFRASTYLQNHRKIHTGENGTVVKTDY